MYNIIMLSEHGVNADIDCQKSIDDSFSVLHWQCKGDFVLDNNHSLCLTNPDFENEAYHFLRLAKDSAASLVLTPEYSIPWNCLDRILEDPDLQPDQGKLWCLCMQYLPLNEFDIWNQLHRTQSLDVGQCEPGMRIIWDGFGAHGTRKHFVNMLAYIFKDIHGQLIVLFQSKVFHMRDIGFQFEASGLSLGNTIFIFDGGSHDIRAFCSIICADAMANHLYDDIQRKLNDRKLLIFHPQLNSNPYFADIMRFVNVFIDRQWNFLRLNWTPDTKLIDRELKLPGTGYIYKSDRNVESYWNSPSDRNNYIQNRAKGLHFLINSSLRAHWLFPSESHASLYHLSHPRLPANAAHTPHVLTAGELYDYVVGIGWQARNCCPWSKIKSLIPAQEQEVLDFLEEIHCTNCAGSGCALIMVDRFISMLRGQRDHEVLNEAVPDSYENGCVTNLNGNLYTKSEIQWKHADWIGAYLRDICQISRVSSEPSLQALQHMVPDGVRIDVPFETVQNRISTYNVRGKGQSIGRLQKGLAVFTEQTNPSVLDALQVKIGKLTSAEELGVMLFYPAQTGTVELHPNVRWKQLSDISPSGTTPKDKSDIGLGGY